MWCPHCQSDAPQSAISSDGGPRRCWRCGRFVAEGDRAAIESARWLGPGSDEGLDLSQDAFARLAQTARKSWDDWTLAAEVRRARRIVTQDVWQSRDSTQGRGAATGIMPAGARQAAYRVLARRGDQASEAPRSWPLAAAAATVMGILVSVLGLMVIYLMPYSFAEAAPFGLALMLWGLVGLTAGALVQLSRVRADSRRALDRVRLLEAELAAVRRNELLFDRRAA